jgi:hypothetical protein
MPVGTITNGISLSFVRKTFRRPPMQIELRPLDQIKPYPGNPRQNDEAVDAVAASNTEEIWVPAFRHEGLYEVSSFGRVRRSSASRMAPAGYILKSRLTWDGYVQYGLCKHQRYWHVKAHRLVAVSFLGLPPFSGAHVAHGDGDKTNNHVSNLRWATPIENEADKRRHGTQRGARPGEAHHGAKLNVAIVQCMRRQIAAGCTLGAVAGALGVAKVTAYQAIVGQTWATVTDPAPLPRLRLLQKGRAA